MEFGKPDWRSFERGIEKEWLITNGIGGFASSTIIGTNTRRYHGLLIASLKPPVQRHLILSKIDESIEVDGKSYNLYSFRTPDYVMEGFHHLQRVSIDHIPTFIYSIEDLFVEKKVCMIYGENTVVVTYHVINGESKIKLKLTPLVNFRDYHYNSSREHMRFTSKLVQNCLFINSHYFDKHIKIYCGDGTFTLLKDCWFLNMEYSKEIERGLRATEDHYIPGYFEIEIKEGEDRYISVITTIENELRCTDGLKIINEEEKRIQNLISIAGYKDDFALRLVRAADDFIVNRQSTKSKTIIAGYPWFTDWGRDTMIALPGLTLVTRRYNDAKEILYTFSKYINNGLVPNMFPDEGHEPAYNSVDASLWYFEAVNKYLKYTGDYQFIKDEIFTGLKNIIESYANGTIYNIKMDEDSFITAGDRGTQLTWMDAKVGNWAITPRHGRAVEINALWYNALKIIGRLAEKFGEDRGLYETIASKVRNNFPNFFWNKKMQCLYDVIYEDVKDHKIRPNQILSVSLSNAVIEGDMARKVVHRVWKHLYTPYGIRTLSPYSDEYRGIYKGDQHSRDASYHQGTAWAWLLGHFITAFLKSYGHTQKNKNIALMFIKPFEDHLRDACIGSISEIFDGNEPHIPRGCFAQAWSVAEVLRAYVEDIIQEQ